MKRYLKSLLLAVAAFSAVTSLSFGQTAFNFSTVESFTGSLTSFTTGRAFVQTFTSASLLSSVTYRFSTTNTGTFAGTTLNTYFSQWDPNTNRATGSAIMQQTIAVPGSASFTTFSYEADPIGNPGVFDTYRGFDFTFNLNATLQSDLTYAMILVGTAGSSIGLQSIDSSDAFVFGESLKRNSGVPTSSLSAGFSGVNSLSAVSSTSVTNDWGFSAIAITIVPEPSTAAAAIVAGFLGVMVIRRRLQQRAKVQPVTVA